MSSVEKVGNVLDDRKEEVAMTPLSQKKSLTKYVDKGTDELEDMKEAVVTIRRKDLNKFEGQYKGYIGGFNLDSKFLSIISTIYPKFYKNVLKRILKVKTRNYIKRLL